MDQQVTAVYGDGVFRPLSPVELPEGTLVKVTVEDAARAQQESPPERATDAASVSRQTDALDALRRQIEKLPKHTNRDNWSVRQHDELLYGGSK